jgi:hypothetical protein
MKMNSIPYPGGPRDGRSSWILLAAEIAFPAVVQDFLKLGCGAATIGMGNFFGKLTFPPESLQRPRVAKEFRANHLDRDASLEFEVLRFVDLPMPPGFYYLDI